MIEPVTFGDNGVALLDQRQLPHQETWIELDSPEAVATAIRDMVVRGAPAIGVAAGFGMALAARAARGSDEQAFRERLDAAAATLAAARPTAVNLAWAVERVRDAVRRALEDGVTVAEAAELAEREAVAIKEEDIAANRAMGRHGVDAGAGRGAGADALQRRRAGDRRLRHRARHRPRRRRGGEDGRRDRRRDPPLPAGGAAHGVGAAEGRHPGDGDRRLDGRLAARARARSTWSSSAPTGSRANGDVANKIGTYPLAVLARRHGVPFYVAAPLSTFDPACPSGDLIPIEERSAEEVTHLGGMRLVPEGVSARHPAFDVTPAAFVTAIVTEAGIVRAPFPSGIARLLGLEAETAEPAPLAASVGRTADEDENGAEEADTAAVLAAAGNDGEESPPPADEAAPGEEELFP